MRFLLSILLIANIYSQCQGDMNDDGIINVVDIVAQINFILGSDGVCEEEPSVHGCLDSQACNYNPNALIDNNSCYYCYNDDCDTYPESEYDCEGNCTDSDDDDICDNVDDCVEFSQEGYHCGDLDVLKDLWSINGFGECQGSNCANILCEDTYGNSLIEWDEDGRVERMILSYCGLTALPESFGNLTNLYHFSQQGEIDIITSLPESFGNLINLERLDMSNCQLESLPESFGSLTSLYQIDIAENSLTSLPESFSNLNNLENLYLANNQLTTISENIIGGLINLQNLILYRNELTSIPENICELNLAYGDSGLPYIPLWGNKLCEEYRYDCFTNDSFDLLEGQDQSNCCEGVNDDGETVPNWTTCPE